MKRTLLALVMALPWFAGPAVQAQPLTVGVNFLPNGKSTAAVIPSNGNAVTSSGKVAAVAPNHGSGGILLTHQPPATVTVSATVTATQLGTFSDADPTAPDHFTNQSYKLALQVTNPPAHTSKTLTFTGKVNGTLTYDSASINNTFTSPTVQKVAVGPALVTASIGPFIPPGSPNGNNGLIDAHLSVQPLASGAKASSGASGGTSESAPAPAPAPAPSPAPAPTPAPAPAPPPAPAPAPTPITVLPPIISVPLSSTSPSGSSGTSSASTGSVAPPIIVHSAANAVPAAAPGSGRTGAPPAGVSSSPEPSSLVLAGLGLSSLGLAAWRKRRRS